MPDDLVARLRARTDPDLSLDDFMRDLSVLLREAADEIERLRKSRKSALRVVDEHEAKIDALTARVVELEGGIFKSLTGLQEAQYETGGVARAAVQVAAYELGGLLKRDP